MRRALQRAFDALTGWPLALFLVCVFCLASWLGAIDEEDDEV